MYIFRYSSIRHAIAFGIGAAIGVLYFMSAVAANADILSGVSIADNGQTMVKGARVTAVTPDRITAVTEWGSASVRWTVEITGNTRFTPLRIDKEAVTHMIHVGERIGFNGLIAQNSSQLLVYATSIRNESVMQAGVVLDGTLLANDADGFVIQTDDGTSTIRVSTGTIMTKQGNHAALSDLVPGDTIKAFGTFNARSRVLDADRLASASVPRIPNTGAEAKPGFFERVISWLRMSGRALTLR